MRLPMMARSRVSLVPLLTTVATASLLLAGCAGDATSPSAAQPKTMSALKTSPFVPTGAQRALVGVADGTYTYEIDPSQAQSLSFGASHLDIPRLEGSGAIPAGVSVLPRSKFFADLPNLLR